MKKVCFIGHRKIEKTEELERKVRAVIEDLIKNHDVGVFLFGSRSKFDVLCHAILEELMPKYPFVKRVAYNCRSEASYFEKDREWMEQYLSKLYHKPIEILCVDETFDHKTKWTSGKASYVERNQAMINDSDFCVLYYDENYLPPKRKWSKHDVLPYQPKSGTALAFKYAKQKKKIIINIFDLIKK